MSTNFKKSRRNLKDEDKHPYHKEDYAKINYYYEITNNYPKQYCWEDTGLKDWDSCLIFAFTLMGLVDLEDL